MKLTHPTDQELSAAVAEKVAGWYLDKNGCCYPSKESHDSETFSGGWPLPPFATSADAVLLLLEKHPHWEIGSYVGANHSRRYVCRIWRHELIENRLREMPLMEYGSTFARCACLALLRAHGIEVVE